MMPVETLTTIEMFFANYPFLQECRTVSVSVIFGGAMTVLINRGSIRKQCYFELVGEDSRDAKIHAVKLKVLGLNKLFREKRPLIHKCLTGTMLTQSASIPADWHTTFYDPNSPSIVEMTLKEELDDDIRVLRLITAQIGTLKNQLINSLEKLIFPGWIAALKRKLKPIKVIYGDALGIWRTAVEARKEHKV